ncbi:MAG: hypothetical protein KAI16_00890 [Candidatus Pacebacteria bacterium]|nr:hypothetical protein [Candidatus Paceibacterota bacterium]
MEEKKNIFILLESKAEELELINFFMKSCPNFSIYLFFWDTHKESFFSKEKNIKDIESELFSADIVVNLLPKQSQIYREIGQKLEKMKLLKWQNSIATNLLFLQKSNIKKLFEKFNIKTPVFKKISKKEKAGELFLNFPQPSRIFSKSNDYFSEKLESLKDIEGVFNVINISDESYYIEEYVEGIDWYVFIFKDGDEIRSYFIEDNNNKTIDFEDTVQKIDELSKKVFLDFGIEKFALLNIKKTKKGKIYFLNIFSDLYIFNNSKKDIIDKIFEKYDLNLRDFLQSIYNI